MTPANTGRLKWKSSEVDVHGASRVGHEQTCVEGTGLGPAAVTIDLAEIFHRYREAAILRLQSLYPTVGFAIADCGIVAMDTASINETEIRKAVLSTVYREKIYAETLPMRLALVAAVTSR